MFFNQNTSQDLVIAENKTVKKNGTDTVMAYCLEPEQQAVPGANLKCHKNIFFIN